MPFRNLSCLASPDQEKYIKSRRKYSEENELQLVVVQPNEIPEEEKGMCIVNLEKTDGCGLGLTVSGGVDKDSRPRVSSLRSTGIAAKSGQLQVDDFITAVNGIRTSKLKHGEIISLLKNIGERVCLEVEYRLPPTTVQTATILQKTTEIHLRKVNNSFGFVLRGGYNDEYCKIRPIVVTSISPSSPADKEGSLKTGDRIIAIGSTPLISMTLDQVSDIIRCCNDLTQITIEYDVSVMEAVANANGPLLIEMSKTPGAELGLTLTKSTYRKKPCICIDYVKPASISDRCGALHTGDQILSIDHVTMASQSLSVKEASDMLNSFSDQVKLEILPVARLAIAAKPFNQNRFAPTITSQSMHALNSRFVGGRFPPNSATLGYGRGGSGRFSRRKIQRGKYSASAMSLASTDFLSGNQIVHTEAIEVHLLTDDDEDHVINSTLTPNFGIQLQGSIFSTEILNSAPVIAYVEPERAAQRCGLIQTGDRLVSINRFPCEAYNIDEINQLLSDAYSEGQALLEIEFDVAESVLPSSGTFHAKLPKRRGVDLGIVVSAPTGNGDYLLISKVEKGSVAHRTGTLEVGDRLLSIDGVKLEDCTPEDANELLSSAEDVVRLKVRKDEENSEEPDTSRSISYTVELKRHGGPLGVTISGTEEPFDPVVISSLTPGGLAARTGAIHEGDKILSINSVSLRAKPLSEAIKLLKNAGETVNLKIKRQILEETKSPQLKQSRFTTSTVGREQFVTTPAEHSDPEDDILPERMKLIHSSSDDITSGHQPRDRGVRPGPAGAPSIDSAVELDSSVDAMYKTRSSAGSHVSPTNSAEPPTSPTPLIKGRTRSEKSATMSRLQKIKDPILPSKKQFEILRNKYDTSRSYSDTWSAREQIRARNQRSPDTNKLQSADWESAIDDLQSVGQSSDYLRDLETKLTLKSDDYTPSPHQYTTSQYPTYQHMPPYYHRRQGSGSYDNFARREVMKSHTPNYHQQLHKVTITKEGFEADFGFSLSDGRIEPGVYVHSIKPGGPAYRGGVLPYDRILQINGMSTHDSDCNHALPLVASAHNRLELLLSRNYTNNSIVTHHQGRPLLTPPAMSNARSHEVFPNL